MNNPPPPPPPAAYAPTIQLAPLAELFDLTPRRVQQLATDGIVIKAGRGVYQFKESVQGYIKSVKDISQGKGYTDDKVHHRTKLDKARAKKATIEADRLEGSVVSLEEVQFVLNETMVLISTQMDGIGGRLAGEISGLTDAAEIRKRLLDETRRIRAAAASKLARLGIAGASGADITAAAGPAPGPVGE